MTGRLNFLKLRWQSISTGFQFCSVFRNKVNLLGRVVDPTFTLKANRTFTH